MIQLKVLSGKKAGTVMDVRRFPFSVGRSGGCDLSLDDAGIWEKHFEIDLNSPDFSLASEPNTSVMIDGKSVQKAALRNGEIIDVGFAKILFGFSPTHQKSLTFREWLTWIALIALCLSQITLIYKLLH